MYVIFSSSAVICGLVSLYCDIAAVNSVMINDALPRIAESFATTLHIPTTNSIKQEVSPGLCTQMKQLTRRQTCKLLRANPNGKLENTIETTNATACYNRLASQIITSQLQKLKNEQQAVGLEAITSGGLPRYSLYSHQSRRWYLIAYL